MKKDLVGFKLKHFFPHVHFEINYLCFKMFCIVFSTCKTQYN